jgi:hypothetical protein
VYHLGLAPETDIMGQFLGPETDTFFQFLGPETVSGPYSFFSPEFWPIEKEKKHLNKRRYKFKRNKKNPFEQKLAHFKISGPRN